MVTGYVVVSWGVLAWLKNAGADELDQVLIYLLQREHIRPVKLV